MKWLDDMSYSFLIIIALFLGLAPISPEPHLVEKFRMLTQGTLTKPIDIFDVFYHLIPVIAIAVKYARSRRKSFSPSDGHAPQ